MSKNNNIDVIDNKFGLKGTTVFMLKEYTQRNGDYSTHNIVLGLPSNTELISNKTIYSFLILSDYFHLFLKERIETIYHDLNDKINKQGGDSNTNEKDFILNSIKKYFDDYIEEYEIEICYEIEKEGSPYYINNYQITKHSCGFISSKEYIFSCLPVKKLLVCN